MVDYVDMAETYLVAGDFDSRKRYLRIKSGATLAVCSGITWEASASPSTNLGQPWCGWRWSLGARGSESFVSFTVSGTTQTQTVTTPSPTITDVTI